MRNSVLVACCMVAAAGGALACLVRARRAIPQPVFNDPSEARSDREERSDCEARRGDEQRDSEDERNRTNKTPAQISTVSASDETPANASDVAEERSQRSDGDREDCVHDSDNSGENDDAIAVIETFVEPNLPDDAQGECSDTRRVPGSDSDDPVGVRERARQDASDNIDHSGDAHGDCSDTSRSRDAGSDADDPVGDDDRAEQGSSDSIDHSGGNTVLSVRLVKTLGVAGTEAQTYTPADAHGGSSADVRSDEANSDSGVSGEACTSASGIAARVGDETSLDRGHTAWTDGEGRMEKSTASDSGGNVSIGSKPDDCVRYQVNEGANPQEGSTTDSPVARRIGNYAVLRRVGHGNSSSVFAVQDVLRGTQYAMKVAKFSGRIENEIDISTSLVHPHILRTTLVFYRQGCVAMLMRLCERSLEQVLDEVGVFDEFKAADVMRQVTSALCHCHANGICHRDVKPENVLVCASGDVLLADFSIAARFDQSTGCVSGYCGTPLYAAPEIVFDTAPDYDGRQADVFSTGIMLYTLTHGYPPFRRSIRADGSIEPDSQLLFNPGTSSELRRLLRGMLRRDPLQRLSIEQVCSDYWFEIIE